MNQRTKRRLVYGIVSFAMLYGLCMVIGNSRAAKQIFGCSLFNI